MPAPTAVELLWGTQQRARRGPKPALSLERIVGEAIALADAEGLANLSMQRLAERLGFTKMSLYRYVPGKAELTALMLDTAIGTPPAPTPDWRAGLQIWADTIFARYSTHPWTIDLTTGQRHVGPNELGWMETALTALAGTGLTGSERLDTIVLLNGHVRSLVEQLAPPNASPDTYSTQLAETMAEVGHLYPAATAAFAEEATAGHTGNALQFGIDRILDGLAVLITQRGT
ncbi:TetR/AcrR family transcriptional regulator [Kribbella italica]|uniref:AcrR family transcriptional regulator n=1 Tax=Kribbella italica TaxID=1540520 RepID=A0A7W9MVY2_9ACTN|nr:TetR/AcrR family transcriptional regulator [Kribbella italica]MBB5838426.1 AcrR family transcriptional regulator [Kribbella italica]